MTKVADSSTLNGNHQQNLYHHQLMTGDPADRKLSLIDPSDERVSTILVWRNLTVTSREKKSKEFLRKVTSCNRYIPKRKRLLNSVTGVITGGLWAVMGK